MMEPGCLRLKGFSYKDFYSATASHFDVTHTTMTQTDPDLLTTLARLSALKRILEKDFSAMDETAV